MGSVRESFELIFVAILTGVASGVICGVVGCRLRLTGLNRLRRTARSQPHDRDDQ
jgi:hypothetical protein